MYETGSDTSGRAGRTGREDVGRERRHGSHRAALRDLGVVLADLSRQAMEVSEDGPEDAADLLLDLLAPAEPVGSGITHVHGTGAVELMLRTAVAESRVELLGARRGRSGPSGLPDGLLGAALAGAGPGIATRTLYQHTAQFDEDAKEEVRTASRFGALVRTTAESLGPLLIVDATEAFISAPLGDVCVARISDVATVRFLVNVFEQTWAGAEQFPFLPVRAADAAPRVVPAIRASIQRLLVEGFSDKAIARRLGISERSLQAHVFRIKQDVGARSRIQLGYLLGRIEEQRRDIA